MEGTKAVAWWLMAADDIAGAFRPPETVPGLLARFTLEVPANSRYLHVHRGTTLAFEVGSDEFAPVNSVDVAACIGSDIPPPTLVIPRSPFLAFYTGDDLARQTEEWQLATFITPPETYRGSLRSFTLAFFHEIRGAILSGRAEGLLVGCMVVVDGTIVVLQRWRSRAAHENFLDVPVGFFMRHELGLSRFIGTPEDHPLNFLYVARPNLGLVSMR